MVSEFPFHKQYFPWQEQQAKSFERFWDIFEWGSREQPAATSLLTEAWTSINPNEHNGIKPQFICTTLWKKRKERKSPLGLKTPYALNWCTLPQNTLPFTSGNKSVPQRENTAFFMSTAIIRQNTRLMCWMFSSLEHTEKHGALIRSRQFKLNVILYLSDTILLLNLMRCTWMTGLPILYSDMQPAFQKQSNCSWHLKTQVHNKKKCLKKRNNFIQIACHQQHNTPGLFTSWDVPCRTLLTKCLSENAMYKKKKEHL